MSSSFETNRLLRKMEKTIVSKLCEVEVNTGSGGGGGGTRTARFFEYEVLSGIGTFTLPANTISGSFYVVAEGASGSVTLTTPSGTGPLFPNQTVQWGIDDLTDNLTVSSPPTVTTTNAGDIVAISYTRTA